MSTRLLRGLVLQQVAAAGLLAHDLAAARDAEALLRAAVRLHLRHGRPISFGRSVVELQVWWCGRPYSARCGARGAGGVGRAGRGGRGAAGVAVAGAGRGAGAAACGAGSAASRSRLGGLRRGLGGLRRGLGSLRRGLGRLRRGLSSLRSGSAACALGLDRGGVRALFGGVRRNLVATTALGLGLGLGLGLLLGRAEHHDHVAAVLLGVALDEAQLADVLGQPLQQPVAQLGAGLLAPAEHDRHLDLVAGLEEPLDVALLGAVVVRVDLRAGA